MDEANEARQQKRYAVKQKLREVEGYSYQAHLEHIEEVKEIQRARRKQMEEEAKLSFDRGQRDMSARRERMHSLMLQLEEEAVQSKIRLAAIEEEIQVKSAAHQRSIEAVRERMQEKSDSVERVYDAHLSMQEQVQNQRTAKVVEKYNTTIKKLNRVNKDLMSKTMILREHNDDRFTKRDVQYS